MKKLIFCLLAFASMATAEQCQITSPLPVPVIINGCNYTGTLPGGATSYVQNTNSLQAGATFYVSSGTVAGQFSPQSILWPDGTVQVSSPSAGGGGGTPGGGDLEVQFNQAGSFGGSPVFAYDYVNGRLGIGAAPSAFQLEITSDSVAGGFVGELIQNNKATGNMGLIEMDNSGNQVQYAMAGPTFGAPLGNNGYIFTVGVGLQVYMSGANPIVFSTNSLERMAIKSSGNVGINTDLPSTLLHMSSGTFTIDGNTSPAITIKGSGAPPDSMTLCLVNGALGHCTSVVSISGGCTCTVP